MSDTGGYKSQFMENLKTSVTRKDGLSNIAAMMEKHSVVNGEPMSFKDHEMQIAIANDMSSRIAVQKCSQVGLSEIQVQKVLMICVGASNKRLIFSLPTRSMAQKFSNDRFNSAIDQSSLIKGMVATANNSVEQKMINTSKLYITGTWGENSAISIPANFVINDEVDFSNQDVLGKMESRLRHNDHDEHGFAGHRFMFSTPTVNGFGINVPFELGDQKYYAVRCKSCNHESIPDYEQHFVLPGFDRPIGEFSSGDMNDKLDLSKAMLLCPKCGTCLYKNRSLYDPTCRRWLAKFPGRAISSYQVMPWDVPRYNPPEAIIRQATQYATEEAFFNFVLGIPRTTDENSFNTSDKYRGEVSTINIIQPDEKEKPDVRFYMGVDVGKTCHVTIGVVDGDNELRVVNALRIRAEDSDFGTKTILNQLKELYEAYDITEARIDAGPDFTLASDFVEYGAGTIKAVEYGSSTEGLTLYTDKDMSPQGYHRVTRADRTKLTSIVMRDHNKGRIKYARQIAADVFSHLKAVKRIMNPAAKGGHTMYYASSGDDHFAHSVNYLRLAADQEFNDFAGPATVAAPLSVVGVHMKNGGSDNGSVDQYDGFFR